MVTTVLKTMINNLTCFLLGHTHVCECIGGERLNGPTSTDPRNPLQVGGRRGHSGQRILDFLPIMLEFLQEKSMLFVLLKQFQCITARHYSAMEVMND